MNNAAKLILMSAMLLAAAACVRRPLEDPNEVVTVQAEVNVQAVANVTTYVYNKYIPTPDLNTDMMRVLIYDPGTKKLITQSFISSKRIDDNGNQVLSGSLNISYGTFDILIYNFDTPTIHVSGENNEETILAYTEELPLSLRTHYLPSKAGDDEQDDSELVYNYEPDHFIVAHEESLRVSPHDSVVVIRTEAHTIVDTYYLQVHVTGMEYASSATAVITGLSPSNYFGRDERTSNPIAAVSFDLRKSRDESYSGENKDVLCALFNTFGKIPDASSDLHVTFNVIDTGGNLQQMDCSLDEIFKSEDAVERHWLLIDKVFEIHKPDNPNPSQSGGFQPMVGEWENVESDISL